MTSERKRLKQGLIQCYFGRGKGKTTAALGQGFRAIGHGFKVYMIQFMKGDYRYGELESIKNTPNFEVKQFGTPDLISEAREIDLEEGRKALEFAEKIITSDEYDIVILDGVICEGTKDFGICDRACFYFWRVEWLEKI